MSYEWKDLPEPLNCFTTRNATLLNLNNGKIIQHYSANTKIVVVQKCVAPEKTYYRTRDAVHHHLNYAFEASAFGLPNEKASSAPSSTPKIKPNKPASPTIQPAKNKQEAEEVVSPKDEGARHGRGWWGKFLRRKNG